ncbi:MAG: FtsX-like permease family protein, partial [Planctomycetota bacterium]|nr:FtsX-like permease family protein [Planctomycetota bacterium]
GALSLAPAHQPAANAFVPLATLQKAIDREASANTILLTGSSFASDPTAGTSRFQELFQDHVQLEDLGLRMRINPKLGYVALESEAMLLEPAIESAANRTAAALGKQPMHIYTYLANTIAIASRDTDEIPYSTVAALDRLPAFDPAINSPEAALSPGEIILNDWAARDLNARIGSTIRLTYYVNDTFGRLDTEHADFELRGIVPLAGAAADSGFTPEYAGITDTENVTDWDPPFPIDLGKVRDRDESYWDQHRATPKAFISLEDGRRLWTDDEERFGSVTALRLYADDGEDLSALSASFRNGLLRNINVARIGLRFEPVREQAAAASKGSTEFGGLFIGFSLFLILSACLLVALLFRLGIERRAAQVGILLASGYSARRVFLIVLAEGAAIAGIGTAIGGVAALGYAELMLGGLRTWWADAANAPFLQLHVTPVSLAIGLVAGGSVAVIAIAWSVRGLTRQPPKSLLAGAASGGPSTLGDGSGRASAITSLVALALAVAMVAMSSLTEVVPPTIGFFVSGVAMLVACLSGLARFLRREPRGVIHRPGPGAIAKLGIRNARRHPRRSLLTVALIASATFVIAALQAFRLETDASPTDKHSGTGGFALWAETIVPLAFDLNTPEGRESLSLPDEAQAALADVRAFPFRMRIGEEASCLNLYKPTTPTILGAGEAMIRRGGFTFGATMATKDEETENPWTLLNRTFDDRAVPVIGDEASVLWQLHLGLGKDLVVDDERGRQMKLRFVGLLRGSALQGELVVSEANFTRLFPSISGHAFFLIESPASKVSTVEQTLERELAAYGFDVAETADRLRAFFAVQNTYLSTFQTLGGLGLILGTIGVSVVQLRNVWERRGELALMRSLGFSRAALGGMVLAESAVLVAAGLAAGAIPAFVAIGPHLATHAGSIPFGRLAATLAAVFAVGMIAGAIALRPVLRGPLIEGLRAE